jgi:polyisoprenoid-binding protein YceI
MRTSTADTTNRSKTMTMTKTTLDGTYELDRTHSTVQFAVLHAGVSTFRGSFTDVDARLVITDDIAGLEAGTVVESISIVDPPEFREHVVRGEDFFAADAHPRLEFRSTRLAFDHDGALTVYGVLEIRGVKQHVSGSGEFTPPTEDPFGNTRVGIAVRSTLDRRLWGMDWQMELPAGGDALGWVVEVTAQLEFTKSA